MRILAIPQVTAVSGATESDLTTQLSIIDQIGQIEPTFAYLWGRTIDQDAPGARVEVFAEESVPNSFYALQTAVTGRLYELFNRITSVYPVDVILTSRVGAIPALMVGLQGRPDDVVPAIAVEPRVYAPGDVAHQSVGEVGAAARAVGYALAFNVFWSEYEREAAMDVVDLWMSKGAVRRASERSFVIPLPVVQPIRLSPRSGSKRLLFAGRLNSNKRWREVVAAYRQVMQTRTDVDVWIHSGTGVQGKVPDGANWFRTSERFGSRDEYLRLLASANVGAYASTDEGSNLTVLEMISHGVVMALPMAPWVDKLIPDYPYRFKSIRELPALLDWMLDHEAEARRALAKTRRWIGVHHDPAQWEQGWRWVVGKVRAQVDATPPLHTFREDVAMMLDRPDIDQVTFQHAVQVGRIATTRPNQRQLYNHYDAWRSVRDWDTHDSAVPVFERK